MGTRHDVARRLASRSLVAIVLVAGLACGSSETTAPHSTEGTEGTGGGTLDLPPAGPELPEPFVWYRFEGSGMDEMGNADAEHQFDGIEYVEGYEGLAANINFGSGHFQADAAAPMFWDHAQGGSLTMAIRMYNRETDSTSAETIIAARSPDRDYHVGLFGDGSLTLNGSFTNWPMEKERWHEVVIVVRSDVTDIYVDGRYIKQFDTSAPSGEATSMTLGARSENHTSWFVGRLDDIRFYGEALDREQAEFLSELGD